MNQAEAFSLAYELMHKYNLPSQGWHFKFDRSLRRHGYCNYTRKTISLSRNYVDLNTVEKIRNTILHEIAHAIVGYEHGHNSVWKAKAIEIGCTGERCTSGASYIPSAWIGICPNCNREIKRHRRRRIACTPCCIAHNYGKFDARFLFRWKQNKVLESSLTAV